MFHLPRRRIEHFRPVRILICNVFCINFSQLHQFPPVTHKKLSNSASLSTLTTPLFRFLSKSLTNVPSCTQFWVSLFCTRVYKGHIPRYLRKRVNKRAREAAKSVLNEELFRQAVSRLPPRFTNEELHNIIVLQDDPLVCFELFNWASNQHRFKHNVLTFHITIQKLGVAKMYEEMDVIVNQVLAVPLIASEALFNTMIYYFTEARKLVRAVHIYKVMCSSWKLDCRPSIRTYNILFSALLSRRNDPYINYMYMETIRCLFKQMVDDGVEPDLFSLNCMIKGYVMSLHVNDALRIFHQMGVIYDCQPNAYSHDYLIHGLCVQGRTINAREFYDMMKAKGFLPSSKSYNSLVTSLAIDGEIDEAVEFLWEMASNGRVTDFLTYRTVLNELWRRRRDGSGMRLLMELKEKRFVDGHTHSKLLSELQYSSWK